MLELTPTPSNARATPPTYTISPGSRLPGETDATSWMSRIVGGSSNGTGPSSNVNPGFSAELAYVSGHAPLFAIVDSSGAQTDTIRFPIQR